MQFRTLIVAAAVATAHAKVELTDPNFAGITAGEPFDITWNDVDGAVTLVLLDDTDPNNATPITTIACMFFFLES
jgi:hypothetical protein